MASINASLLNVVQLRLDAVAAFEQQFVPGPKIAYGFIPETRLNVQLGRGRTLPEMQFKNYYLGAWADSDMQQIDRALAGAMTDPHLNRVIQQYLTRPIATQFLGSTMRQDIAPAPGSTFDRNAVQQVLASLDLGGIDKTNTVICLYLPPGVILGTHAAGATGGEGGSDIVANSLTGLSGYHGSSDIDGQQVLFGISVYSQVINRQRNGIPFWPDPWKNVVTTMYHELNEIRTDPDVEEAIRSTEYSYLGWYSPPAGEIGDIPLFLAGTNLGLVMVEVPLAAGGTAPIQLLWSNSVGGPGQPY
ncbi:MAG TPA: hypothetical protein VF469_24820 [Kofleriaceae bacterium]